MDNFDFVDVNVLGMTPQHGHDEVVNWRNGLVYVVEVHVQKVL